MCDGEPGPLDLSHLQRWFLSEIQRPQRTDGACDPVTALAGEIPSAEDVLLSSRALAAQVRMKLYSDMYFLRLREVLQSNFEGIYALLGDAEFSALVRDFLTYHPSQSFTLNALGEPLPEYFASERGQARWGERAAALENMATLERAVERCFRAQTTPILEAASLANVPEDAWGDVRFEMSAGFAVMAFDYNVNRALNQVAASQPAGEVWVAERSWVVVWRRGFDVWRQSIGEAMYVVLKALRDGQTMGEAIEAAAAVWGEDAEDALEQKLFAWFADWVSEGFFAALVL